MRASYLVSDSRTAVSTRVSVVDVDHLEHELVDAAAEIGPHHPLAAARCRG